MFLSMCQIVGIYIHHAKRDIKMAYNLIVVMVSRNC